MNTHDRRSQLLAGALSALAGYVDATGFLAVGGFFVSFMSGNSTRMGIGIGEGTAGGLVAAALIAAFLAGVVLGTIVGHAARARRRAAVLVLVSVLLAAGAASGHRTMIAALSMAAAMGVLNNTFERNGEVSLGVTYMTGSLVKLGQRVGAALLGGDRFGWVPYLALWLSFVAGVACGAASYPAFGLSGLWGASALALCLAAAAWRTEPPLRPAPPSPADR